MSCPLTPLASTMPVDAILQLFYINGIIAAVFTRSFYSSLSIFLFFWLVLWTTPHREDDEPFRWDFHVYIWFIYILGSEVGALMSGMLNYPRLYDSRILKDPPAYVTPTTIAAEISNNTKLSVNNTTSRMQAYHPYDLLENRRVINIETIVWLLSAVGIWVGVNFFVGAYSDGCGNVDSDVGEIIGIILLVFFTSLASISIIWVLFGSYDTVTLKQNLKYGLAGSLLVASDAALTTAVGIKAIGDWYGLIYIGALIIAFILSGLWSAYINLKVPIPSITKPNYYQTEQNPQNCTIQWTHPWLYPNGTLSIVPHTSTGWDIWMKSYLQKTENRDSGTLEELPMSKNHLHHHHHQRHNYLSHNGDSAELFYTSRSCDRSSSLFDTPHSIHLPKYTYYPGYDRIKNMRYLVYIFSPLFWICIISSLAFWVVEIFSSEPKKTEFLILTAAVTTFVWNIIIIVVGTASTTRHYISSFLHPSHLKK